MTYAIHTEITLEHSLDDVFSFFSDAANLEAITPPELRFEIKTPLPIVMKAGAEIEYRLRLYGIPFSWRTEISVWEPGIRFVDQQISGPFQLWIHEHRFSAVGPTTTRVVDDVRYRLPLQPLSRMAHPIVRARLDRIFDYRQQRVPELIAG